MNIKLNKLKLITLSSLIFLGTAAYNNNYKATAQQNNTTSVERVGNKPSNSKVKIAEIEGYTGVVKSCTRSVKSVTCEVLITTQKEDSRIHLDGSPSASYDSEYTRIIDNNGNEYPASSVGYGNKESRYYVSLDLIQAVPQKVIFSFTKIPAEVNKIAVLEVSVRDIGKGKFKLDFRDVVIFDPFLSRLH